MDTDHNIVIVPDAEATVVNKGGNHSIRGGTLAKKLYNAEYADPERLQSPHAARQRRAARDRLGYGHRDHGRGQQARVGNYGESAWAMKTYSYEFFMNTYAITKLALGAIKTPAFCEHDKPARATTPPAWTTAA